jgi:hypothetical protein
MQNFFKAMDRAVEVALRARGMVGWGLILKKTRME